MPPPIGRLNPLNGLSSILSIYSRSIELPPAPGDEDPILHQQVGDPLHVDHQQAHRRHQPQGFQEPVRPARLLPVPLQVRRPGVRNGQGRGGSQFDNATFLLSFMKRASPALVSIKPKS